MISSENPISPTQATEWGLRRNDSSRGSKYLGLSMIGPTFLGTPST